MFCKNCGSELLPGAKFCSECGTKVEDVVVRDFDTLTFDEAPKAPEIAADNSPGADEAFKERVSFDWSNVIDEPQKKDIPQGIKSPWAATTDSIDERQIYEEMTQSDDKNRTMNFIDVLKADREERERAALDKSIEYTEVLEIDPELLGGTKPPKLHYAPLYEDVDEPVRTPFDDMPITAQDENEANTEPTDEEPVTAAPQTAEPERTEGVERSKFELPDFLKRAVGFGAAKETSAAVAPAAEEPAVEDPAYEEPAAEEPAYEEPAAEDPAYEEPAAEEPAYEEPAAEEPAYESDAAEDLYLDEDIYLDLEERTPGTERISRVDAHTLAGDYDMFDEDNEDNEDNEEDSETAINENELFEEMSETPIRAAGTAGMTIAAPADEEAEIEALKRRLAELTGTVEIDPAELEATQDEEPQVVTPEPVAEPSPEPVVEDFTFEPEITEADNAFFAGLTPASEAAAPEFDDFSFEPEVTADDDAFFAGLTPAREFKAEPAAEVQAPEADALIVEEPVFEAPADDESAAAAPAAAPVGIIEFAPPAPNLSEEQKAAFAGLNFDLPNVAAPVVEAPVVEAPVVEEPVPEEPVYEAPAIEEPTAAEGSAAEPSLEESFFEALGAEGISVEEPASDELTLEHFAADSPIVGFAPAVTEKAPAAEPVIEPAPVAEPVTAPIAEPVIEPAPVAEPKPTDALSLDELERDLFGASAAEAGASDAETKKIDKFYTLYRKNEEFQRLLDEEYSRLRGEHVVIPEDDDITVTEESPDASEEVPLTPIDELFAAEETRPVEDATIYQEMPEDFKAAVAEAEARMQAEADAEAAAASAVGFSAETLEAAAEANSETSVAAAAEAPKFGLDGSEIAAGAAAAAGVAAAAGAVAEASDGKDAKSDKAAARAAKKAAKEAKKAEKAATKAAKSGDAEDAQEDYETVDGGSTVLTILAVIVAILLVVLLVIILVLHVAPASPLAMAIERFIENITSKIGDVNALSGYRLL